MFGLVKKMLFVAMKFFSFNSSKINYLKRFSMNNQECKVKEEIINTNNNEPVFYPFSTRVNKCSMICNKISNPYARSCVPSVARNMNLKLFNLMSWSSQTEQVKWHES